MITLRGKQLDVIEKLTMESIGSLLNILSKEISFFNYSLNVYVIYQYGNQRGDTIIVMVTKAGTN